MHGCLAPSRSAAACSSWAGLAAAAGLLFLCTNAFARETPDRDPVETPSGASYFQTKAFHRTMRLDVSLTGGALFAAGPFAQSFSGGGNLDVRIDWPVDDSFRVGLRIGLGIGRMNDIPDADCGDGPCYQGASAHAAFLPAIRTAMEWREAPNAFFELSFGGAIVVYSPAQEWRHHAVPNWAVGLGQVFHVWRRDDMILGIRAQLDVVAGQGLGPIYLMLVPTAGLSWSCSPGRSSGAVARSGD